MSTRTIYELRPAVHKSIDANRVDVSICLQKQEYIQSMKQAIARDQRHIA